MPVVLRLTRTGAKKKPAYRVVAANSRKPRDGRFLEILGVYDPKKQDENFMVKEERVLDWLSKGAQPSDTVKSLLKKTGLWGKFKTGSKVKKESGENS
ncbi:MAG: 30S ribosomal protein S16 [Candidatus Schekmanbacteria bacterium GWA2_38_11]|uniref:Small ribosomal subunit protein bS16 n=1 Tax=Candidatus Schekmanbacteria bacterium GWA2_38_11 TaxID=1817876 RepID=A0A1F7RNV7_9BACT|nr:MAG: 30S ribosomal protein S16 [Candidatus Schekmanbacteria bacterium GWA2_38_11]